MIAAKNVVIMNIEKGGSSFNNDLIVNGDFTWKYFTVDAIVGLSSFGTSRMI